MFNVKYNENIFLKKISIMKKNIFTKIIQYKKINYVVLIFFVNAYKIIFQDAR